MTISKSEIANNYPASAIRKMFELANKYDDVIKLTLGEPDFNTPDNIKTIAKESIDNNQTHYVSNAGVQKLRESIIEKYKRERGLNFSLNQIMVTFGAMEAIYLGLMSTINPGDEVLVSDPGYPNYIGQINMLGANAVPVPVHEENNFRLKAKDVDKYITSKTKGIIINSPSNPHGAVLEEKEARLLAKLVEKYNLIVISDEVYDEVIFDEKRHFSMAEIPEIKDNIFIINSFSKSYAMTGWRIGYIIGTEDIVTTMSIIQEGLTACVPEFIQSAAIEALEGPQDKVEEMRMDYQRRRGILIEGLNGIPGFSCAMTEGAFYVFVNIKSFNKTSEEFAVELLKEAGVAVTPGSAFGENGEGYLRVSFANSDKNLKEAIYRIRRYVDNNYKLKDV